MLSRANNSGNSSAKTPLYGGLIQLGVPPTPTPRSPTEYNARVMLMRKVENMREGSNENEPVRIAPKSSESTPSVDDELLGTARLPFPCDCKICRRASSQGLSAPSDAQSSIGVLAPPMRSSSVTREEEEGRVMLYEEHEDMYVRMTLKRKFEAVGEGSEEDGPPRVAPRYLSLSRRGSSTRNANTRSAFEVENGVAILPLIGAPGAGDSHRGGMFPRTVPYFLPPWHLSYAVDHGSGMTVRYGV